VQNLLANLCVFSATFLLVAIETWLNRNRYLIVAAFQGISAKKEVNKKDPKQKNNKKNKKTLFACKKPFIFLNNNNTRSSTLG
jgi:hypothetical protein